MVAFGTGVVAAQMTTFAGQHGLPAVRGSRVRQRRRAVSHGLVITESVPAGGRLCGLHPRGQPGDLPAQAPNPGTTVVNLKTAKVLGPKFLRRCSPASTR